MRAIEKPRHRAVMLNILKDIYSNRDLGINLGFKGGTAAYFFYGLTRFSVDLDFNLLDPDEIKARQVYSGIEKIMTKYGRITDKSEKFFTIFLELNYERDYRNLKVEISTRADVDEYELLDLFGISCKVMKKEYMFARKLLALTMRSNIAARDLYDINFFLANHWEIETRIIEEVSGKSFTEYIEYVIEFVRTNFNTKNVLDGVGDLLDENQRDRSELKSELIEGTIFALQSRYLSG